ncbi:mechanosensitive ion channel family protein [uncultured Winogradskyella sp.]|uniref:mechanosensitive ion channel family protein n=1 Tax=uncultured Winogradskyella sp. TaxID=395353 RepID=UPI00260698FB|nr:mechanosensitive ion channel family protein [uncultured Winogradskyella sp.]
MNEELETTTNLVTNKLESWSDALVSNLPNIGIALLVMVASYFMSKLVYNIVLKLIYKKINQTAVTKLIARTSSVVIVIAGLFLALSALNLSQTVTGLLTGAGISGIVIGLALQGTLSNTIAGIVLSFRKNIRYGNWIKTNGYEGEVIDIALNYLTLKEADNNLVVIPNKTIIENPFKNFSLTKKMRVSIECGVGYNSDLDKVKHVTLDVINKLYNQEKIDETAEFYYTHYGDSSINFLARFWVYGENGLAKLSAKSDVIIALKKAFDKENINIPFPIRTLNVNSNTMTSLTKELEVFNQN